MKNSIKMVVTDMDGTLLNSKKELPVETMEVIDKLLAKGVMFVIASGRQYFNLHKKLNERDDIIYLAENGCYISKDGKLFRFKALKFESIKRILDTIKDIENAYPILCGKKGAYTTKMNKITSEHFTQYYAKIEIVNNFEEIDDKICKISILDLNKTKKYVYPLLNEFYDDFNVTVASHEWLDIIDRNTNKGSALEILQQRLGIKKEETMAFGDYFNDYEMLQVAGESYAMQEAHDEIKKITKYVIGSNDDNSVIKTIKEKFDI